MNSKRPASFDNDLAFAEQARKLIEDQLYAKWAYQGRYVSLVGGYLGVKYLQLSAHIDAILQVVDKEGNVASLTVEEKIVRAHHAAFTIETHSDQRKPQSGWIYTSTADALLYAFSLPFGGLRVWTMSMRQLREWFVPQTDQFKVAVTPNMGRNGNVYYTECRIVPIRSIPILMREYYLKEEKPVTQRTRFPQG